MGLYIPRPYTAEPFGRRHLATRGQWRMRPLSRVFWIVAHRCDVVQASKGKLSNSVEDCARFFCGEAGGPRWHGHPYHFDVDADGLVVQTNSISALTYGVALHNTASVHVRVQGDFRKTPPPRKQYFSAAALVADLILGFDRDRKMGVRVRGHSEFLVNGALKGIAQKQCPGRAFDVPYFRRVLVSDLVAVPEHAIVCKPHLETWWAW